MSQSDRVENQRELLKEYFLYSSLKHAFGKECFEDDYSASYYVDVANYGLEAFRRLDSLSAVFVQSIPERTEKKKYATIYLDCLEKSKSEELQKFIFELDKYFIE